jgi:hypothetical protein
MSEVKISRQALESKGLRIPGYAADVLRHTLRADPQYVWMRRESYEELRQKYAPKPPVAPKPLGDGPGSELKALLAVFGIHSSPTCKCNAMARKMNEMEVTEPGWSLAHIEEVVDVMEETAKKRNLPFLRTAGRILVRKAVRNWQKKGTGK